MLTLLKRLPARVVNALRLVYNWRDVFACARFIVSGPASMTVVERFGLVRLCFAISLAVDAPHSQGQILEIIDTIESMPPTVPGAIIEAGCYKGGSTAKLSLAADRAGRTLLVFDSFRGMPENVEHHRDRVLGERVEFNHGSYEGTLQEVRANVTEFGRIASCQFVQGWFQDTLPGLREPLSVAFIDVDLASSTRVCLKYLYPLLQSGGTLFSHDGHLKLVVDVFADEEFWRTEVGGPKPVIEGLGTRQLIKIVKR